MHDHALVDISNAAVPGLFRRLAAILYDSLVLGAVLIVAGALVVVPLGIYWDLQIGSGNVWYQMYLTGVIYLYFAGFWVHGGQTPGMRAWRVRLLRDDGHGIRWRDSSMRLICALISWIPAGLGYLWMLFDRDRLTWHDRLTHTRPVLVNKRGANSPD